MLKVSTRKYGILYEIKILGEAKTIQMTFDMHGKLVDKEEKEAVEEQEEEKEPGVKEKLGKLFGKGYQRISWHSNSGFCRYLGSNA